LDKADAFGDFASGTGLPIKLSSFGWNFFSSLASATCFVGGAYYAIFLLPFRFPPSRKLMSLSYAFGFNNAVCILAIGMLLLVATSMLWLWLIAGRREEVAEQVVSLVTGSGPSSGIPRKLFVTVALAYAGVTVLLYFWAKAVPRFTIDWEAFHFLYRLRLMQFYGLRPYLDFHFEYGPALIYLPFWLHKMMAPLNVSLDASYYTSYFLFNLLGLTVLFVCLNGAGISPKRKIVAFVLLAIASYGFWMGLNGVSSRYLLPYLGVILIHRVATQERVILWLVFGLTSLLALANILISPEIGLAFGIGCVAYALLVLRRRVSIGVAILGGLGLAAGVAIALIPFVYMASVFRFTAGANNYPLLPAPHIILYLLTLFVVVPILVGAGFLTPTAHGPLLWALGVLCVIMMPGALGRCDPPHVLLYGLGASMLMFMVAARTKTFGVYAIAYALVAIVLLQSNNLWEFYSIGYRKQLFLRFFSDLSAKSQPLTLNSKWPADDYSALDKYPKMGIPFSTSDIDKPIESYLFSHLQIAPEYFVGTIAVYGEDEYVRKCQAVVRNEFLLVRSGRERPHQPASEAYDLVSIYTALMYPVHLTLKKDPLDPDLELNRILVGDYKTVERVGDYVVLRRIGENGSNFIACHPSPAVVSSSH
jgi:hypothetical protein